MKGRKPVDDKTGKKVKSLLDDSRAIIAKVKSEGRGLTDAERKKLGENQGKAQALQMMDLVTTKPLASASKSTSGAFPFNGEAGGGFEQIAAELVQGKSLRAEVPLGTIFRGKTLDEFPAAEEFAVQGPFVGFSQDERYLSGVFPTQDLGEALSINDFRQTGTRSVTGSVERDPVATTDKAELDVSIEAVNEEVRQLAVLISDVPNAVFEAEATLRQFLMSEMRLQINEALDQHIISRIYEAEPQSGDTGADLVAKIRNGLAAARTLGSNPTVLVLPPADAAALDLLTDDGGYVFPLGAVNSANPLFGLQAVEAKRALDPLIIDPAIAGTLYRGSLKIELDPYTGFKKNTTNIRAEMTALMHIRNVDGIFEVGGAGYLT
jgi:hypothetical protein